VKTINGARLDRFIETAIAAGSYAGMTADNGDCYHTEDWAVVIQQDARTGQTTVTTHRRDREPITYVAR
jgi:hypothetical protein